MTKQIKEIIFQIKEKCDEYLFFSNYPQKDDLCENCKKDIICLCDELKKELKVE